MKSPVQYISLLGFLVISLLVFAYEKNFAPGFVLVPSVVFIAFLMLAFLLYPYYDTNYKKGQIKKEEREESLREGGIEEPRPHRELTLEEKQILHDLNLTSKKIVENAWWLIPFFLVIDILGVLIILYIQSNQDLIEFIVLIYSFLFVIQFGLASGAAKEAPRYLDLRSPVFTVQGRSIKEKVTGKRNSYYFITVRGIKFSEDNYHLLKEFYFMINDEAEVAVEYSPRTKHVWMMSETEDI